MEKRQTKEKKTESRFILAKKDYICQLRFTKRGVDGGLLEVIEGAEKSPPQEGLG